MSRLVQPRGLHSLGNITFGTNFLWDIIIKWLLKNELDGLKEMAGFCLEYTYSLSPLSKICPTRGNTFLRGHYLW